MKLKLSDKQKMMNLLDEMPCCLSNSRDKFVFCTICKIPMKGLRRRTLLNHLNSKNHRILNEKHENDALNQTSCHTTTFTKKTNCANCLLKCDIPLYKLRNETFQSMLLDFTGQRVPETTARSFVTEFSTKVKENVIKLVNNRQFYLIIDETNIKRLKIWNFLLGFVDSPGSEILLTTKTTTQNSSHEVEYNLFNEIIVEFNLDIKNMVLLISDAAGYNFKFYKELIKINPKIKHVTCFAHLIHNCINFVFKKNIEIKQFLHDVNRLIGKNDQMYYEFKSISGYSKPVATRWDSFMKFLMFIVNNVNKVKEIINKHTDNKSNAYAHIKSVLNNKALITKMKEVVKNYGFLIEKLDLVEKNTFSIEEGINLVKSFSFTNDTDNLKGYLEKRLDKHIFNSINTQHNWVRNEIKLISSLPCTSAQVERSFSRLKKLLGDDRNFKPENIEHYFRIVY